MASYQSLHKAVVVVNDDSAKANTKSRVNKLVYLMMWQIRRSEF
jgi:hypothetical protein